MLKLWFSVILVAFSLGCSPSGPGVENSKKQEQWPGSNHSAKNQNSTNTETGANSPAGQGDKNDHPDNLAKPSPHVPNADETPGDVGQGNDKNPKTEGTTSGPNPKR